MDNNFDTRKGKAEAIQDYINGEEMTSLSLQNDTNIALDVKMHCYWLFRTSALTVPEIEGIQIITQGSTGLSAVQNAIQQTIVARRREEVRDDRREQEDRARGKTGSAGDNVHTLSDSEETESTCGTRWMTDRTMQ